MKRYEVKLTRLGFEEFYLDGKPVKKVCRTCKQIKPISEFHKLVTGNYRPDCKDCFREWQRRYIAENRDMRRVYKQRERARYFGTPDYFTLEDWLELKAFANGRCMISGRKSDNLQVDHVMSLSKRVLGSTKGNIILVCEEVNQAKHQMSLFEFLQSPRSKGLVDPEQLKRTIQYLAAANGMTPEEYLNFLWRAEQLAKDMKEFFENEKRLKEAGQQ